ncbi:MAG: GSCFA domain-containing protein, partial [Bacteroidales bacterium]|nr:GSCFA domain-containing protein [Bacteroidales bacterium]
ADYSTPVLMTGSCFAENIGRMMQRLKFNVTLNPFGIVFHPFPLARQLDRLLSADEYSAGELRHDHDLWFSFDHHGRFSQPEQTDCLALINGEFQQGRQQLAKAKWLFVTFGTAWAYRLKENGKIVANCHHYPTNAFERIRTEADEICETWARTITRLREINPAVQVVFSVSPVRHLRDDAHENQLSKATLLLAVERLNKNMNTCYFPAYEIMQDDLRDYRFYDEDMTHPNPLAIKYIWQRFCTTYFSDDAVRVMNKVDDIVKASEHRPIHHNEATRTFKTAYLAKIAEMQKRFPNMDFSQETKQLTINN